MTRKLGLDCTNYSKLKITLISHSNAKDCQLWLNILAFQPKTICFITCNQMQMQKRSIIINNNHTAAHTHTHRLYRYVHAINSKSILMPLQIDDKFIIINVCVWLCDQGTECNFSAGIIRLLLLLLLHDTFIARLLVLLLLPMTKCATHTSALNSRF